MHLFRSTHSVWIETPAPWQKQNSMEVWAVHVLSQSLAYKHANHAAKTKRELEIIKTQILRAHSQLGNLHQEEFQKVSFDIRNMKDKNCTVSKWLIIM